MSTILTSAAYDYEPPLNDIKKPNETQPLQLYELKQRFRACEKAPPYWVSEEPELNRFFHGGLQLGQLYELGFSFGAGAYTSAVLPWLRVATQQDAVLWVAPQERLGLYPPRLAAEGVNLQNLAVTYTDKPITDLKAAFLQPGFSLIILDRPTHLKKQDMAFLAGAARKNELTVLVLRPFLLSSSIPNPWASVRLNTKYLASQRMYLLEAVRGLRKRSVLVSAAEKLLEQERFLNELVRCSNL